MNKLFLKKDVDNGQLSRREIEKIKDGYEMEFAKLSASCIREAIKLVGPAEAAARKSNDRFKSFLADYPFYEIKPDAPAARVLAILLYFLSDHVHDERLYPMGLNMMEWEDGGRYDLRKLSGLVPVKVDVYNGPEPEDREYQEAFGAYRELLKNWGDDCVPLFAPIEKYIIATLDIEQKRIDLIKEIDVKFPRLPRPYYIGISGYYSSASLITRQILGNPHAKDALVAAGRDIGFWARTGQPKIERENKKFIKVRDMNGEMWLTPEQFREFIK